MTEGFEIHERDGPARLGELRLTDPVTTPAIVDDVLEDAGSLWAIDRDAPEGDPSSVTILPHRGVPAGTREEVAAAFAPEYPELDTPTAAVVSAEHADATVAPARESGVDVYVLSDAQGMIDHGRAFVERVIRIRNAIPPDTALYLPGVATPANVSLLAGAGVDLVDATNARLKGTQGKYLATDGERVLRDITELPCSCPACADPREEFDRAACEDHNVNALEAELRRVRVRIREGRLRDYLEGQVRHENWLTETLRRFDEQYAYQETRTPILRDAEISAASAETLRRVEIQRFAERVTGRYRNRFQNPLVLVPCSARKPYSESQSHEQFQNAIQYRAHTVSMTSPIGVVPQELELTYPAQHYDSVVTGRWSAEEVEFVSSVLRRYLARNEYPRVVAHVPSEGYRTVCERVAAEVDVPFEYTVVDHPTTTESLANLQSTLEGELKYSRRERRHNTIRAIADYMFGDSAGDDLFEDVSLTSRYPKLQIRNPDASDEDGTDQQLATMVPEYGVLAFTIAGARRWVDSDVPTKRVQIDGFVPHGSVLAPGVVDADDEIRVGDEVVVDGPQAFGVGRARMYGAEMVNSNRGEAVAVRHVTEQ